MFGYFASFSTTALFILRKYSTTPYASLNSIKVGTTLGNVGVKRMNVEVKRMKVETKRMNVEAKRLNVEAKRMNLNARRMNPETKRMKVGAGLGKNELKSGLNSLT